MSSNNTSQFTEITSYDPSTNEIELASAAIGSNTGAMARIALPKGRYFIKSGSFNKAGTGDPQDWRSVTGSEDSNYDNTQPKWGIITQLSITSSNTTGIAGLYGQYEITKIQDRISDSLANFFFTSSTTIPMFIEGDDKCVTSNQGVALLSSMENNLMTIAAAGDANTNQGYGLAAYQLAVGAQISQLTSGSSGAGFPFTGSAEITGSLGVTGSVETLINSSENFLIKNASAPTQSLFQIDNDGVAVFRAREGGDGAPSAILGGLYFTTESAFLGVD
jgi:hypothetical protein